MCKRALLFINIFSAIVLNAQKESYNWYFGFNAGITFHSDPPSALTDGQLVSGEGCASMSTAEGKLLFYTNGVSVWDKTHGVMQNGSGLKGNISTTQSTIIIPNPDSSNIFYIFTLDEQVGNDGLQYSVVDMQLNSGNGAVISGRKNIKLRNKLCEKLAAVQHVNGKDYWVLVVEYGSDVIYSYKVSGNGVNTTPVVSKTGFTITPDQYVNGAFGAMKISPDGKKIGYCTGMLKAFGIGDFDALTGKISNVMKLPSYYTYGAEFSPNSNFLYISLDADTLAQFDARSTSLGAFIASKKLVNSSMAPTGAMQLGPDGKIYIAEFKKYLSVINAPDSLGLNCRFSKNSLSLQSGVAFLGLPSFVSSHLRQHPFRVGSPCVLDSTTFSITETKDLDSVKWNFGDPGSGNKNISQKISRVTHIYAKSGDYNITLVAYYKLHTDTTVIKNRIYKPVKPILGKDTIVCNSYLLKPQKKYFHYLWTGDSTTSFLKIIRDGSYILKVKDTAGCSSADTIKLKVAIVRALFNLSDTIQCLTNNTFSVKSLSNYKNDLPKSTLWDFGDGTTADGASATKIFNTAGIYNIRILIKSNNDCKDSLSKKVTVMPISGTTFSTNKDSQCFQSHLFGFTANGNSKKYSWDFGDGNKDTVRSPKHVYLLPGIYAIKLKASYDSSLCESSDTHSVTLILTKVKIIHDKDTQCFNGHEYFFDVAGNADKYLWNFGDGKYDTSKSIKHRYSSSGKYRVILKGTKGNLCTSWDTTYVTLADPHVQLNVNSIEQCMKNNKFIFKTTSVHNYYSWNFGDGKTDTGKAVQHVFGLKGMYTVILTAKDNFSCLTADTVQVNVRENPKSDFTFVFDPCRNNVPFLNLSMNYATAVWEVGKSYFTTKELKYKFNTKGLYQIRLVVSDSSDFCRDTAEKMVDINSLKKQQPLGVPNVFTPDEDGLNDCYHIGGLDATCGDRGEILIYNRLGLLVFKGNPVSECWNGKLNNNGNELPSGVYYYILKLYYNNEDGISEDIAANGVIQLIR